MKVRILRTYSIGASIASLCFSLFGCGTSNDAQQRAEARAVATRQAVQSLKESFPTARLENSRGKLSAIYGTSLSTGATPTESAEQFRRKQATAFGVNPDELTPQELQAGKAAVVASNVACCAVCIAICSASCRSLAMRKSQASLPRAI